VQANGVHVDFDRSCVMVSCDTTIANQKICLTHYLHSLYLNDIIIMHLITLYSQRHLALAS